MAKSASAKLVEAFSLLDTVGPLVTIQTIRAFVSIASANDESAGVNMTMLGKRLGLPSSTRPRVIQALSVRRGGNDTLPGLDLVVTAVDPDDSRALLVFLTPKGRRLWASLKETIGDK
jgi:DNA-binding MarR family transcriptional regulator